MLCERDASWDNAMIKTGITALMLRNMFDDLSLSPLDTMIQIVAAEVVLFSICALDAALSKAGDPSRGIKPDQSFIKNPKGILYRSARIILLVPVIFFAVYVVALTCLLLKSLAMGEELSSLWICDVGGVLLFYIFLWNYRRLKVPKVDEKSSGANEEDL